MLCQKQIHLDKIRSTYCMLEKGHQGECPKRLMHINEYQIKALRTASPIYMGDRRLALLLATAGLNAEAGELINKIKKTIEAGKNIEHGLWHYKNELGDILWYVVMTAKLMGCTLEEIMEENLKKLQERHGDNYNSNYKKEGK